MTTYMKGQWLKYPDHKPKHERYEYQTLRHGGTMETEGRFFGAEGVTQFFEPESITLPPPPALEPEIEVEDLEHVYCNHDWSYDDYNEVHKQAMRAQIKEHRSQMLELNQLWVEKSYAQIRQSDELHQRIYPDDALADRLSAVSSAINDLLQKAGVKVQEDGQR